jgi:hypothetical protein
MQVDITVTEAELYDAVRDYLAKTVPTLAVKGLLFKVSRTGNGTSVVCGVDAEFGAIPTDPVQAELELTKPEPVKAESRARKTPIKPAIQEEEKSTVAETAGEFLNLD